MKKELKAFSLFELLISLGIIATLSTIGIAFYINQQKNQLLDTTVEKIVNLLYFAQQKAINQEQGLNWGVRFSNNGSDFYALFSGDEYSSSEEIYYLPAGISFVQPTEEQNLDIQFYKLLGNSNGGTIIVQGYFNRYVIIRVMPSGLITYGLDNQNVSGYAWNSRIGWIDFGCTGCNVFVPQESGELAGMAFSNNGGWIFLNCLDTNSCSTSDFKVQKDINGDLSGWAWSERFGWISFNCLTDNSCSQSNYKVSINPQTKEFEGYAWSSNLGWISFNCNTGGTSGENICSISDYKVYVSR